MKAFHLFPLSSATSLSLFLSPLKVSTFFPPETPTRSFIQCSSPGSIASLIHSITQSLISLNIPLIHPPIHPSIYSSLYTSSSSAASRSYEITPSTVPLVPSYPSVNKSQSVALHPEISSSRSNCRFVSIYRAHLNEYRGPQATE